MPEIYCTNGMFVCFAAIQQLVRRCQGRSLGHVYCTYHRRNSGTYNG